MQFKITFKNVSADELPEIVDAFAGSAGKVVVSSESTMRKYEVVAGWYDDLRFQAIAMQQLHEWTHRGSADVTRTPPQPESEKQ